MRWSRMTSRAWLARFRVGPSSSSKPSSKFVNTTYTSSFPCAPTNRMEAQPRVVSHAACHVIVGGEQREAPSRAVSACDTPANRHDHPTQCRPVAVDAPRMMKRQRLGVHQKIVLMPKTKLKEVQRYGEGDYNDAPEGN